MANNTVTKIQHIVFDIGRVLIYWDPEVPFLKRIPNTASRQWFLNEVCNAQWNQEQDRGRDWGTAEELLIEQFPGQVRNIRAYRRDWIQMLTHVIEESVEILSMLIKNGHDVTLLTNWNQETYAETRELYRFLDWPRGVTVSGEVKLIKPDPAIYLLHQKTFGLLPDRTLFIDDSIVNVNAARDCGWKAELFSTPEKLREDLSRYELL